MDVEEHPAIIVCDTRWRDDIERTRPEVALLNGAFESCGGITYQREHEVVGLGDIGLPTRGVVERRQLFRWRTETAHGQDRLRLLAD